jgi:hypothetical protein
MASPVVATTGVANDSFGTTLTLAPPASIADGDLLEATFFVYQNTGNDPNLSGWTKKVDVNDAGDLRIVTLYKRASSESGSYVFNLTSPVYWSGIIRRITGAIASGDPYDVVGSGASGVSTSPSASATTTTIDTLVLWYAAPFSSGTTVSPPAGVSGTMAVNLYVGSKAQAAAGSTGALTGSLSPGSDNWVAVVAAIKSLATDFPIIPKAPPDRCSLAHARM